MAQETIGDVCSAFADAMLLAQNHFAKMKAEVIALSGIIKERNGQIENLEANGNNLSGKEKVT